MKVDSTGSKNLYSRSCKRGARFQSLYNLQLTCRTLVNGAESIIRVLSEQPETRDTRVPAQELDKHVRLKIQKHSVTLFLLLLTTDICIERSNSSLFPIQLLSHYNLVYQSFTWKWIPSLNGPQKRRRLLEQMCTQ